MVSTQTAPVMRYSRAITARRHPQADAIIAEYRAGKSVTKIRAKYFVNHDRMYQVLLADKIPLRASAKKDRSKSSSAFGVLAHPPGLLRILPDLRILPRIHQITLANRYKARAPHAQLLAAFQNFLQPFPRPPHGA